MPEHFFISYSSVDARDFAIKMADELAAGPPPVPVWLDQRTLRPGTDWDEQIVEAIRAAKGLIFLLSTDSVRMGSVCKDEWVRALKYKKPIIPILLTPDAELPFRLGSREYIDFTGSFASALARLRRHLSWMDSSEGQLQSLQDRLSDAQRELPRTRPEQQPRIREDIAELETQIAQQRRVIDNPETAKQQVQQSIDAGLEIERKPVKPTGRSAHSRFINPPPLIAPTWFQNRHLESQQIGEFLRDESLRLMTVVGRGGVGKTAMVCRLLRSLEGGQLPDEGPALDVDGIVYLSAARSFHRPNLPDLYAGLTKLLPDETVKQIDSVYKNPNATTRAKVEALAQAFPGGRTVVLLDNFEDMVAVETGQIKDPELGDALRALLEAPPHGLKVIVTSRIAPSDLALVQPGLQRRLDLDSGLEHPYAENILKAMDSSGKVGLRDVPDALLAKARERTLGFPRALEHLFGILSADRDTSLKQILDDTRQFLPEQVIAVLVGEAFSRLDPTAQRVMQALATYRYPVPPAAVDYLLQPYVPGIDSSRVLSRLVNMQFVRRDAGRYYLHQVDRDYALSRIPEGQPGDCEAAIPPLTRFAIRHLAAEWFKLSRKPREAWKTLGDLAAQLSEFELRCEGGEYDAAAAVLLEFDFDYLFLWGHYRLMAALHEPLQGKITDTGMAEGSAGNLGSAYCRLGQVQRAIEFYEQALHLAREREDRLSESSWLANLASCVSDLGQSARSLEYLEESLPMRRKVGYRKGEALDLDGFGNRYSEIGKLRLAIDYYEKALLIDRDTKDREGEALDLDNIGDTYRQIGRFDEALQAHTKALAIARDIGYRLIEASAHANIGYWHISQESWAEADEELKLAIEIADDIGCPQISKSAREGLAFLCLHSNKLALAREMVEAARNYDVFLQNHSTSAMLGLVAVRQGDMDTAREAFTAAADDASRLIDLTADRFAVLDTKGLSLCGLALCGEPTHLSAAKVAFAAARAVTSDAGITRNVLQRFDVLAQADTGGILTEVRPVAGGKSGKHAPMSPG